MDKRKTILLVAMAESIHTARWIEQFKGLDWDIHLFPSIVGTLNHPRICNVTVHNLLFKRRIVSPRGPAKPDSELIRRGLGAVLRRAMAACFPRWRSKQLARVVRRLRPDIVHSMEIQAAGYLTMTAKEVLGSKFPPWIVTNWGSDIYLFGRLKAHKDKIQTVLASCDFYSCECQRDVELARSFGFNKEVLPVMPNTGGFDLAKLDRARHKLPTSKRRIIMLKGYQGWAGRALVGIRALERCSDLLKNYTVVIYSAAPDVVLAAELFSARTKIAVNVLPAETTHEDILSFHAQARISIGLSIGDAISTSLLEAMVMGSFPIQSCTACAEEWVQHSISASIVPPEDPDVIEVALRTALSNDGLVDHASELNWQVALARLDSTLLRGKAIQMYRSTMR